MHLAHPPAATGLCRPYTVSRYDVEHALSANGIHAEIRSSRWDHSIGGLLARIAALDPAFARIPSAGPT